MLDFSNLHIGLTNRCRLECPECTRNQPAAKYIHQMFDIDISIFKKFLLDCNPKFILFCGNWGDPIYAGGFLDLIKNLKISFPTLAISIHTNGSGKRREWWYSLIELLENNDKLIFSIDGTPDNYFKYRINSEWNSVEMAIKSCVEAKEQFKKNVSIEWKYIVFSFNENSIDEAYHLSKTLGFDKFYLQQGLVDNTEGGRYKWLNTSTDFKIIETRFNERKNNTIL